MARKTLVGSVINNEQQYGTGALRIDDCRIETDEKISNHARSAASALSKGKYGDSKAQETLQTKGQEIGRWPANIIHDGSDEVLAALPDAKGQEGDLNETGKPRPSQGRLGDMPAPHAHSARIESDKSAARFFYCAKTSKSDRGESNTHPTVKPTELMRYLCRLVTPAGGHVLDLFAGSGSTWKAAKLEGFEFTGFELSAEYCEIARQRIKGI